MSWAAPYYSKLSQIFVELDGRARLKALKTGEGVVAPPTAADMNGREE